MTNAIRFDRLFSVTIGLTENDPCICHCCGFTAVHISPFCVGSLSSLKSFRADYGRCHKNKEQKSRGRGRERNVREEQSCVISITWVVMIARVGIWHLRDCYYARFRRLDTRGVCWEAVACRGAIALEMWLLWSWASRSKTSRRDETGG